MKTDVNALGPRLRLLRKESRNLFGAGFAAGVLGALAMTFMLGAGRVAGLTNLNLELALGSLLTRDLSATSWWLGLAWHCLNGGIFGVIYAAAFRAAGRTGAGIGAGIGLLHWVAAGVAWGLLLPALHPLVPGQLPAPGLFAAGYGFAGGVIALLLAHLLYGGVVGGIHRVAVRRLTVDRTSGGALLETKFRKAA